MVLLLVFQGSYPFFVLLVILNILEIMLPVITDHKRLLKGTLEHRENKALTKLRWSHWPQLKAPFEGKATCSKLSYIVLKLALVLG